MGIKHFRLGQTLVKQFLSIAMIGDRASVWIMLPRLVAQAPGPAPEKNFTSFPATRADLYRLI